VLERLVGEIRESFRAPGLNPDSPGELLRALQAEGLQVEDTRSWTLEQLDHPGIPALLEYKKLARLLAAHGWNWLESWVRDGRLRSFFVPGGVVTGRWASNGGGALSVPAQMRGAVIADPGWRFVVADVAQLEPRVLAGMSGDTAMAEAARSTDREDACCIIDPSGAAWPLLDPGRATMMVQPFGAGSEPYGRALIWQARRRRRLQSSGRPGRG